MNSTETPPSTQLADDHCESSPEIQGTPRLSHRGLTILLTLMCVVPIVTISAMWIFLPKVEEGTLQAEFGSFGLPAPVYYETDYRQRPEFKGGELIVKNVGDQDWTHLNININGRYQIYDNEPIPAHSEKRFNIDSFVSRAGARFSLRYNELQSARIYARLPTKNRATFECKFKDGVMIEPESEK
jgi:hypothetical protein